MGVGGDALNSTPFAALVKESPRIPHLKIRQSPTDWSHIRRQRCGVALILTVQATPARDYLFSEDQSMLWNGFNPQGNCEKYVAGRCKQDRGFPVCQGERVLSREWLCFYYPGQRPRQNSFTETRMGGHVENAFPPVQAYAVMAVPAAHLLI